MTNSSAYKSIAPNSATPNLITQRLFEADSDDVQISAVDQFIRNQRKLAVHLYQWENNGNVAAELSSLFLLGLVSSVESYFRTVLRRLICIDPYTHFAVDSLMLSYAAARSYDNESLPDGILEAYTFSNSSHIKDAIKKIAGFKGNIPKELEDAFVAYDRVCEIRHCCVHRFGRLGAKNAIALGSKDHVPLLGSMFAPNLSDLETVAEVVLTVVRCANNVLFWKVLERRCDDRRTGGVEAISNLNWVWDYRRDKKSFLPLYQLFSTKEGTLPSPAPLEVYKSLRDGRSTSSI